MREVKIVNGEDRTVGTVEVIQAIVRAPGQSGISYEEMRHRLRILDVVEATNGSGRLLFEDSDYTLLAKLTREFRFGTVHRDLVEIIENILEAPRAEVRPTPSKEQ